MTLDITTADRHIAEAWVDELVPRLEEYIAIPALSPAFDPDWAGSGHIERAVDLIDSWIRSRPVTGMAVRRQELPGRTPLLRCRHRPLRSRPPVDGGTTIL